MKKTGFFQTANKAAMDVADTPKEVRYVLTDYRDGNKKIVHKTMHRLEAYKLNERLKGTGMGWTQTTGY